MNVSRLRTKQELKKLFTNLKRKGITDDMIAILIDVLWRDRIVNRTSGFNIPGGEDNIISFDNVTREFSIIPVDPLVEDFQPRFLIYSYSNRAKLHRKYYEEKIELPDEEGLFVIYYTTNEETGLQELLYVKNPTAAQLKIIYEEEIVISFIYWDQIAKKAISFGNDRHGSEWNPKMHWYLHETVHGLRRPGGLAVTDMQINEDGSADEHARFAVTAGSFWHDDFVINIDAGGGSQSLPILYFDTGNPRFIINPNFQIYNGSGRLNFNNTLGIEQAAEMYHVCYHVFATNDKISGQQLISVMGTAQYEILAEAFAEVKNEVNNIYTIAPQRGLCYLGTAIFQTSDTFSNATKSRIVGFSNEELHPPVTIEPNSQEVLEINDKQELRFIGILGDKNIQSDWNQSNTQAHDFIKNKPSALDGEDGQDGDSAFQIALVNGFVGTQQEWLDSLIGEDGQDGQDGDDALIAVETTCGDEQITNTTDVIAILDTTSGPYTNTTNVDSVVAALDAWFLAYKTANPDFQGNLYIGKNSVEDYVDWLPQLRTNYATGFIWMDGYEMTANAGSEVFLIAFVNESNHAYHDANYPASADTPTAAFIADYDAFVAAKSQMDFFGGIVYPVVGLVPTNVEANFLINTYAAMKAPLDLSETEFSGLTGTNFDNSAYDFAETTNPYLNYPLGLYGWNAVLSKHTIGGNTEVLSFTAQDFADDINNILSGANATTSQVSLFQSYVNQILTLRGVRSNSISLEILPGGCIQMEVNGISTFLESHEQRIADLEQCCDDAPQLVSFDNLNANGSIGQASNQVAFGDHDHEIGDIDVFFENALA